MGEAGAGPLGPGAGQTLRGARELGPAEGRAGPRVWGGWPLSRRGQSRAGQGGLGRRGVSLPVPGLEPAPRPGARAPAPGSRPSPRPSLSAPLAPPSPPPAPRGPRQAPASARHSCRRASRQPRSSAMAGLGLRPAKGYRVVLLGSVAVGKTALATQFACGSFPEQCEPSVEELFSKVIEVNAAPALLEIVDTVGAEHLVTLKDLYIKNSDGFVVLYSVCSEASFEAVRPLRERMGRLRGPKAVPLVLVGTKADLDAQRQVLTAQGRALAREWRCPFLEVTAKSKLMVDQVFTQVVREMEALAPPEEVVPAVPTNAQETWPSERFIG